MNNLFKILCASSPESKSFKNGLAISHSKLGETHASLGNLDQALINFEEQTNLFKLLCSSSPKDVAFRNGLAFAYYRLAEHHSHHQNGLTSAQHYFQMAEAIWIELVKDAPQYVQFQELLQTVQGKIEGLT